MELLTNFKQFIKEENLFQQSDELLLAVSGGADSVVLCELCKKAGYKVTLAHCNFQLRGAESDRDEAFVKQLSVKYNIAFFVKKFATNELAAAAKKSIETTARDIRYEWFHQLLQENPSLKYIVTAHHADDNIETVTMNFFRGTGIAGLHGILPKQGKIIRPLLTVRRSSIEAYAADNKLAFITDSTNLQSNYTRNFFRNQVLPLIKQQFADADKNVLNNISRFKETEILYQQSIEQHKKKLLETKGNELHIPVLKLLKTVPLSSVLYEIIKQFGFTAHQTDEAVSLLKSDSGKYIQSATHRIIKNRKWLIISPVETTEAQHILIEENDLQIIFPEGLISIKKYNTKDVVLKSSPLVAQLDAADIRFPLLLRKWKQGDYFYPLGMKKKKKLSRFFIDQKLSLTEKEHTWVIETNKKIIWIAGKRIDDRFKITANTKKLLEFNFKNAD